MLLIKKKLNLRLFYKEKATIDDITELGKKQSGLIN